MSIGVQKVGWVSRDRAFRNGRVFARCHDRHGAACSPFGRHGGGRTQAMAAAEPGVEERAKPRRRARNPPASSSSRSNRRCFAVTGGFPDAGRP
jgi:hypothetical protein